MTTFTGIPLIDIFSVKRGGTRMVQVAPVEAVMVQVALVEAVIWLRSVV